MAKLLHIKDRFRSLSEPAKATIAFAVCMFLQKGISVLTTPIFTRIMPTDQYGYYAVFTSWLEIVSVFATFKIGGSIYMRALIKFEDRRDELTSSTIGLGSLLVCVCSIVYYIFRRELNSIMGLSTGVVGVMLALCWIELAYDLWASQQRCDYKFFGYAILTVFISVLKPTVGTIAVLSVDSMKAEARIYSQAIVEFICYIWIVVIFLYKNHHVVNLRFWRYSLALNTPLVPHYLSRIVLGQCDRVMINYMIGVTEAGIYSLGHSLAWLLTLVTNSILSTLNPWMFRCIKRKDFDRLNTICLRLLAMVACVGWVMILSAPEIVSVFAPDEYHMSIWVIPPLCMSVYFTFLYSLFAVFEYYYEKTRYMMAVSVLGGVLNIVLNYYFIRWFGMIAAGYTTMFCYIVFAIIHCCCMKLILREEKIENMVFSVKQICLISILFVIIGFITMLLYGNSILRYVCVLVMAVFAWLRRSEICNVFRTSLDGDKNDCD